MSMNILVEAGVLKLFYRTTSMVRIFGVSTVMNAISYSIIAFNFLLTFLIHERAAYDRSVRFRLRIRKRK
jgi:hypothetical protein